MDYIYRNKSSVLQVINLVTKRSLHLGPKQTAEVSEVESSSVELVAKLSSQPPLGDLTPITKSAVKVSSIEPVGDLVVQTLTTDSANKRKKEESSG